MKHPVFVVTGAPNKGKSTFVKAMTNDASVVVGPYARTTTKSVSYPFELDGETLFTLWDTPGFENAAEMHEVLTGWGIQESDHPVEILRRFIETYEGHEDFLFELEIFKPVVDYACIVYVADCSRKFSKSEYLREIELIKFTRLPRIAILNPIDGEHHLESWRSGLTDYFNNIKVFNPHKTSFDEKLRVLGAFSHLDDEWEAPLNRVIDALRRQREKTLEECARIIRRTIIRVYDREFEVPFDAARDEGEHREELLAQVRQFVRSCLDEAQKDITRRFGLSVDVAFEQEIADNDLFDATVRRKNLSVHQRAMVNAIVGGGIGAALDTAAGGLTFGIFTASLGLGGGALAYLKDISPMDLVTFGGFDSSKEKVRVEALHAELGMLIINRLRQVVAVLYNRTAANTEQVTIRKDLDPTELVRMSRLLGNMASSSRYRFSEKHKIELFELIHEKLREDRENVEVGKPG